MSNTLAIATVTETLRHLIHRALPGSGVGGGARDHRAAG